MNTKERAFDKNMLWTNKYNTIAVVRLGPKLAFQRKRLRPPIKYDGKKSCGFRPATCLRAGQLTATIFVKDRPFPLKCCGVILNSLCKTTLNNRTFTASQHVAFHLSDETCGQSRKTLAQRQSC